MGLAYFLWFIIGLHYLYLNQAGWQFFYWFTLGGFFIWTIIDLFRIPSMTNSYNKDTAINVLRDMRAVGA